MSRRVLVVDRNPHIHRLVEANLHRVGYEVEIAFNAEEAQIRMLGTQPDVLLMTAALPEAERYSLREWVKANGHAGEIRVVELNPSRPFTRWL